MSDDSYLFCAENIGKSFTLKNGRTITALDSVSFAVRPGGVTALVGPDGAGKSTLLRIVAGLLKPGSGSLLFDGTPYAGQHEAVQANMGYMPQKFGLYEDLSVQENMDLYADLRGVDDARRESRYAELLAMCAMEPFRTRLAGKLSGGMKQKLGLICTLIAPPRLLLLDEPTVGVDPLSRRELWQIVERLAERSAMSVIVSTSYLDEAARCDEVVLLFEGKTLARGTPESIRQRARGMGYLATPHGEDTPRSLQARLLAAPGIVDAVPQGGFVRFVHGPLDKGQSLGLASLLRGAEVRATEAGLEDSFMLLLRDQGAKTPNPEGAEHEATAALAKRIGSAPEQRRSEADAAPEQIRDQAGARPDQGRTKAATASKREDGETEAAPERERSRGSDAPLARQDGETVIETRNVSRLFGDFIAVNDVSFSVRRGEVFGLLGPNGAGKTTTFRMLCGLLPASKGSLHVAGVDVRHAREEARRHLGYVAQKFSLYGPLSVRENLEFFAGAYGLRGKARSARIKAVVADFSLERQLDMAAEALPGGYKQRLAMAVGLLHEPAILFLDEPTSGADPLARRDFWKRISGLSDRGVTIVVTTHFMEEAEYCDRVLIQDSGVMLALDTPGAIRGQASRELGREASMEEAFISIVAKARAARKEMAA